MSSVNEVRNLLYVYVYINYFPSWFICVRSRCYGWYQWDAEFAICMCRRAHFHIVYVVLQHLPVLQLLYSRGYYSCCNVAIIVPKRRRICICLCMAVYVLCMHNVYINMYLCAFEICQYSRGYHSRCDRCVNGVCGARHYTLCTHVRISWIK